MPEVTTDYHIRSATLADTEAMLAIYAPMVQETTASFELTPPTSDAFAQRIERAQEHHVWLALEVNSQIAGYAYAGRLNPRAAYDYSVETSIYLSGGHRGRGFGRILYEALFEALINKGYCHAFAGITLPNEPSVGLHEAVGFRQTGVYPNAGYKFDAWHDVGWWYKTLKNGAPTGLR